MGWTDRRPAPAAGIQRRKGLPEYRETEIGTVRCRRIAEYRNKGNSTPNAIVPPAHHKRTAQRRGRSSGKANASPPRVSVLRNGPRPFASAPWNRREPNPSSLTFGKNETARLDHRTARFTVR